MLRSMTGFGKGEVDFQKGTVTVEIRSLNHRFLDINSRLPASFYQLEIPLLEQIKRQIKRGSVYLNLLTEPPDSKENHLFLNHKIARRYYHMLSQLKKSLNLKGEIKLNQIMSFPNLITYKEKSKDINSFYPAIRSALDKALKALIKMREEEGRAIFNDLSKRAKIIKKILAHIERRSETAVKTYQKKLSRRIKQLVGAGNLNKERLETEVALFVKNCDIQEEITRLLSHINNFERTLREKGEMGKKLDFITQEMQRESNTIGQKAGDFKISEDIIQIKGEIEKIKEQVQNVE